MIKSLYPTFQRWSEKGSVWLWSDPHFDDPDCKYMSPNWPTPEEHLQLLKKDIHKNDTSICLGDVGNPEYVKEIPGYKVLIMGNHDQSVEKYAPYFDEIYTGPVMIAEKIILSHEPVDVPWAINLHGHDHSPLNTGDSHHINFAANVVGYVPISLGKLIKDGIMSRVTSIHRITIDKAAKKKVSSDIFDMDWIHDDITWCSSDCDNRLCFRHPSNMRNKSGVHSYADFKDEGECPLESQRKE